MNKYLVWIAVGIMAASCAGKEKREEPTENIVHVEIRDDTKTNSKHTSLKPSPVVLVLGPGAARAFVGAGVIKALEKADIEIGAIVGSEFGALIGAMYLGSKSINEFEWKLTKLSQIKLSDRSITERILENASETRGQKIENFLRKEIVKIENSKVQLYYFNRKLSGGQKVLYKNNISSRRITAAITDGVLVSSAASRKLGEGSAAFSEPYPVEFAHTLGIGPVIVVDSVFPEESVGKLTDIESYFLSLRDAKSASIDQLDLADAALNANKLSVGYDEFFKQKDAMYFGETLVRGMEREISFLTGRSQFEPDYE